MIWRPFPARMGAAVKGAARHRMAGRAEAAGGGRRGLHLAARTTPPLSGRTATPPAAVQRAILKRLAFSTTSAASGAARRSAPRAFPSWAHHLASAIRNLRTAVARPAHFAFANRLSLPSLSLKIGRSASLGRPVSPLLQGALATFRASASTTTPAASKTAYTRIHTPFVTFAHGLRSGAAHGVRPTVASLTLSPLRGGVGLQTARKFSSGGSRLFDNMVVHAPLALRLAGDEAQDKAKLATRRGSTRLPKASASSAAPRRTGSQFASATLARRALNFATSAAASRRDCGVEAEHVRAASSVAATEDMQFDLSTYFHLPTVALPCAAARGEAGTVVTIRLIDPLFDALGGRAPQRASDPAHPRLFDAALLRDATAALEYEHTRYLQAKAVLRVLWQGELLGDDARVDLSSDPAAWTIVAPLTSRAAVRTALRRHLGFDCSAWVRLDDLHPPSTPAASSSFDVLSLPSTASSSLSHPSPPPSTLSAVDVVSLSSTPSSSLASADLLSWTSPPPSSVSAADTPLYDSRLLAAPPASLPASL